MILKRVLLVGLMASLGASSALCEETAKGSFDSFKNKVENISKAHGVETPDLGLGQSSTHEKAEKTAEAKLKEKMLNVPKIERIVPLEIGTLRAIKSQDGRIMFVSESGRYVFTGAIYDIWKRKRLTTIEEIETSATLTKLADIDFDPQKAKAVTLGEGKEVVTVFVDPHCGWCHRLMEEVQKKKSLLKEYTFAFVTIPALGDDSNRLAKKLYCSVETKNEKRFAALFNGADGIEKMESLDDQKCDLENYTQTLIAAKMLGIKAVPFIVMPDGRSVRGMPQNLEAFLKNQR